MARNSEFAIARASNSESGNESGYLYGPYVGDDLDDSVASFTDLDRSFRKHGNEKLYYRGSHSSQSSVTALVQGNLEITLDAIMRLGE